MEEALEEAVDPRERGAATVGTGSGMIAAGGAIGTLAMDSSPKSLVTLTTRSGGLSPRSSNSSAGKMMMGWIGIGAGR